MKYTKNLLTIQQLINLLKDKGLRIDNETKVGNYLNSINYFRLKFYFIFFIDNDTERFVDKTNFYDLVLLYEFDEKLRSLVFQAIIKIEILLKAKMIDFFANKEIDCQNPFNHEYIENYKFNEFHSFYMTIIKHAREKFKKRHSVHLLDEFLNKYEDSSTFPIWMAIDQLSLGELSRMIDYLTEENQINFVRSLNICELDSNEGYFVSLVKSLCEIRNVCAHNELLFGRLIHAEYIKPKGVELWGKINLNKIGGILYLINFLLSTNAVNHKYLKEWKNDVESIIVKYYSKKSKGFNIIDINKIMDFDLENNLWKNTDFRK